MDEQDELPLDGNRNSHRSKGGKARAAALSRSKRKEIAQRAAQARWHSELRQATHQGVLHIGDLELPCAVLEDGTRVLSERGASKAFGLGRGGHLIRTGAVEGGEGGERLPQFLAARNLRPFIDNELGMVLTRPIMYLPLGTGRPARGLDAQLIPKVCEVWLAARDAGALRPAQLVTAAKADALIRALARTGIVALVDEATGYQEIRDRFALQAILDAYLSRELAAWAKRFPNEFYQQIFRLRNWKWGQRDGKGAQGPRVVGKYTNDFVYSRLAPGILEELQKRNPPNERGRRPSAHHQWLTEDVGHPALAQHVHALVGLLRASESWEHFIRMIDKAFPRRTKLDDLPLFSQDNRESEQT